MTNQQHLIDLPSHRLVQKLMHESGFDIVHPDEEALLPIAKYMKLAARLIQYGADQELNACCEWLENQPQWMEDLRAARRPKPPSLKEKALAVLEEEPEDAKELIVFDVDQVKIIRRALEALND